MRCPLLSRAEVLGGSVGGLGRVSGGVQLPSQLLGLNKNTSAEAKQSVSYLDRNYVAPLTAVLVGEKPSIYGDGQNGATPFFFVVAGELPEQIASPDNVAQKLQKSWSARGITGVKMFPAGPGSAPVVCGQTQNKDNKCSWVDHVSLGYVLYPPGANAGQPVDYDLRLGSIQVQ